MGGVRSVPARLGLTPQKPLHRAYQRDPQAIERWPRETYPGIAVAARQSGADLYFWDESGFGADTVHGKTWTPKGKTPVVQRPGNASRFRRPRQSTPRVGSGLQPTRAR